MSQPPLVEEALILENTMQKKISDFICGYWLHILFVLVALAFAKETKAMATATCSIQQADGSYEPCTYGLAAGNTTSDVGQICAEPITSLVTGKKFCPINTPGQVIGQALTEQLNGAP